MENPLHAEHCMVCGTALIYAREPLAAACHYCGRAGQSLIHCPAGHYVCDPCHGTATLDLLPKLAERVRGEAPEAILEELFALPALPMHGPEHHPLAALALLLAAGRQGQTLPTGAVPEAIRRAMQIPGGACGALGGCGAGLSLGVAVSLLTGATPLKGKERRLAHRASALGLTTAGDGAPRCCKRALRLAVRAGRRFFTDELNIAFPEPTGGTICRDSQRNRECPRHDCPFFPNGG